MPFVLERAGTRRSEATRARARCQRCLRGGVWTYECGCDGRYVSRASASERMRDPRKRQKFADELFRNEVVPDGGAFEGGEVDDERLRRALDADGRKRGRGRRVELNLEFVFASKTSSIERASTSVRWVSVEAIRL
ncbi:hypothetical protein BE221DRAFT_203552 [Ostreococcus tauri]|uniref:Zinc finger, CCHC-type n=1 Tax=Ostreococcus tauri TaxID=70448 RepID=A0A1Y5IFT0_OSTTA|nr:hypothetical protein BE221DRAFT_203552 [Ostreococcus tauri]